MKYPLVGDGVFSLKFGGSPSFDRSLFTDTELDTCEPDLLLITNRDKKKINYRSSSVSDNGTNSLVLHRWNVIKHLHNHYWKLFVEFFTFILILKIIVHLAYNTTLVLQCNTSAEGEAENIDLDCKY